jgi:hypothetical protein
MNISLVYILIWAIAFFISAALVMVTYNNSIPKMNPSWNKIDYPTAMVFSLFLMFIVSNGVVIISDNGYSLIQ